MHSKTKFIYIVFAEKGEWSDHTCEIMDVFDDMQLALDCYETLVNFQNEQKRNENNGHVPLVEMGSDYFEEFVFSIDKIPLSSAVEYEWIKTRIVETGRYGDDRPSVLVPKKYSGTAVIKQSLYA